MSKPKAPRDEQPLTRPVRLLHLSDLHFSAGTAWDSGTVLDGLVKDVAKLREAVGGIDLVVVTGDIANAGQASEYEAAWTWLSGPLAKAAGVGVERIRVVPGNHDVDRSLITRSARLLAEALLREEDPQAAIAEVLGSPDERRPLLARQGAWMDFARRFHSDLQVPWWREVLRLQGWQVHLAGFNSAWLSSSDADRSILILSRLICNQLLEGADDADLSVALLHHPWDYVHESDRESEDAIRRRCGLILRGHLHQARAGVESDPDRATLLLAAGSCYAGSRWPNSYQLLELDPGRGAARIHLRTWDNHDWIPDRNRYQSAPDGVATLPLRLSPRAPIRPPPTARKTAHPSPPPPPDPLADYTRQLTDRADVLAQVFRAPGGPATVSKVYVEVRLSAEASALAERREESPFGVVQKWLRSWLASPETTRGPAIPQGPFKLESVAGVPHARWAVLGDPGGGKTTLLRHAALTLLEQGDRLPVLLKISELKGDLGASVTQVYGADAAKLVAQALRDHRLVLLLDGLDEATDREAALTAVRRVASEIGPCPLVLASRPIGWQRPSGDFVELALCPLGREEQRQLLDAWVPDTARVTRALARLDSSPRLRRLAENPLLLTLVALLLREREDIPERRGELYERAIQILLTRAADPQRAQRRLREPDLARQALAYAALKLHGRSEEVYRTADLVDALQGHERHRSNLRELWGGPSGFLAEVAETTGLLVPTTSSAEGAPAFAFPHRTFREHLAAVALERDMAVHGLGEVPAEVLRDAARSRGEHGLSPAQGELGRVLGEAWFRPERWSEVLALVCALVGSGSADALVRRVAADGSPALVQRVVAEAEGISSDTVLAVLGCERGWRKWEQRQKIIEEVPALVGDAGVAVRLLDRLRRETTDGNDLYWIRETLKTLAGSATADPDAARDARETLARLFDHLPAENLEKAKALLAPRWRTIPRGGFMMGSTEDRDEQPIHQIHFTSDFLISNIPVTWEIYRLFDPGQASARDTFGGKLPTDQQAQVPVYNVTWYAASMFAAWVGARLPLEPEWEYACRAGTTTRYWSGETEADLARVGWYGKNSGGHPHPVGQKHANPWGLYDVHGNVWEWCQDWYQPDSYGARARGMTVDPVQATYTVGKKTPESADSAARDSARVLRGGSCVSPEDARSALRLRNSPSDSSWFLGFRLVRPPADRPVVPPDPG